MPVEIRDGHAPAPRKEPDVIAAVLEIGPESARIDA